MGFWVSLSLVRLPTASPEMTPPPPEERPRTTELQSPPKPPETIPVVRAPVVENLEELQVIKYGRSRPITKTPSRKIVPSPPTLEASPAPVTLDPEEGVETGAGERLLRESTTAQPVLKFPSVYLLESK